jgi:hypothetical protein
MHFAAVEAAAKGGPYADYLARAASLGSARRMWEQGFGKVADAAVALASEATRLGVIVATDAGLCDLRRLFEGCAVVTVVAHWRGPEINAGDIQIEPDLVIDRLHRERSPIAALLRAGFPPNWQSSISRAANAAAQKSRLAEILDGRMRREPYIIAPPAGIDWHMDAATLRHANRTALQDWWPDAITPGNRLELADGLHAPERVVACVPRDWSGIADLSNCQSAQLIDKIKQGRPDRIVIANERETSPLRRMALLSVIYDLLSKKPCNYAQLRIALSEAMVAEAKIERRR